MNETINMYGDKWIQAGAGHGADIASQRQDELDKLSIERVREIRAGGHAARVLDVGSGRGAQAKRLLEAGATLGIAIDRADFEGEFLASVVDHADKASFLQLDLGQNDFSHKIMKRAENQLFDIVVFQRTIHYFPHDIARKILHDLRLLMASGSRLYISASGIGSELGTEYAGKGALVSERFSPLAPAMAQKHGIHPSVCLYTTQELASLCQECGLRILMAQESEFGNIKIVAEPL